MRYVLAAFAMIMTMTIMLTGFPARAQMSLGSGDQKTPLQLQYEREDAERKENEKAYNTQMKRLKAQGPAATSSDPWKGVRSSSDAAAKR